MLIIITNMNSSDSEHVDNPEGPERSPATSKLELPTKIALRKKKKVVREDGSDNSDHSHSDISVDDSDLDPDCDYEAEGGNIEESSFSMVASPE